MKEESEKILKGNVDVSWNVQWKTHQFFFIIRSVIWLNASLVAVFMSVSSGGQNILNVAGLTLTVQMFQCLCHESNQNNESKKIVCRQLLIRQQLSWLQHKNFIAWLFFFYFFLLSTSKKLAENMRLKQWT